MEASKRAKRIKQSRLRRGESGENDWALSRMKQQKGRGSPERPGNTRRFEKRNSDERHAERMHGESSRAQGLAESGAGFRRREEGFLGEGGGMGGGFGGIEDFDLGREKRRGEEMENEGEFLEKRSDFTARVASDRKSVV